MKLKEKTMRVGAAPRLLYGLGIVAIASLLAPTQPVLAQDGPKWIVTEIAGQVREQGASAASQSLARGSVIEEGRTIETGPNARLVLMHGKDLVTVSPNSAFRIPPSADPGDRVNFIQTLGTILYRVEHLPARGFEVDTPALAAVVKGTMFTVAAGKTADSVHVAGGAVQVTSLASHEVALLHPGEVAVVSSAGRDLTILGHPAPVNAPQRHSEYKDPDDEALGASASAAAPVTETSHSKAQPGPRLTRVMGEEHLDIPAVTKGLLASDKERGHALYFAAGSSDGQDTAASAVNADATGGANALGGSANALGGNANAMGGNANALGGTASALGGTATAINATSSVVSAVPSIAGGATNAVNGTLNTGAGLATTTLGRVSGLLHGHGK